MLNDAVTSGFAFFQMQHAALRMAGASSFVKRAQITRCFVPVLQDTDLQKTKSPVNQQVKILSFFQSLADIFSKFTFEPIAF